MSVSVDFLFVKQKTAYEMRISDWSSDVCSSDLGKEQDLPSAPGLIKQSGSDRRCLACTGRSHQNGIAACRQGGEQIGKHRSDGEGFTHSPTLYDAGMVPVHSRRRRSP